MSLLTSILRGEFSREVALLTGGTALGQLLVVAVTPLLTRLYVPADMGVFGLFSSFVSVASTAACWRLDFGVATARSQSEAAGLVLLCLAVCPATSIALAAVLAGLIRARILSFELLSLWTVPAALVALVMTGVFGTLRYWHVGRRDFRVVSGALVMQGAGRATVSLACGVIGGGWAGLLIGDLAGRVLGVRRLWRPAAASVSAEIARGGLRRMAERLRSAWRYPLIVLPSSVLDALGAALPLPLIAVLFGPSSAGYFALAWRIATVPSGLVSASVADVFHAHSVAVRDGTSADLRPLVTRTLRRLALTATAIYLPLCLLAPAAFGWVFGPQWQPSGSLMLVLLPLWWTSTVVSPISRLLIVVGRPALKLVFDACFLILPAAALVACRTQGLDRAVLAYGLTAGCVYAGFAILLLRVAALGPSPLLGGVAATDVVPPGAGGG